eukprot:COSAG01_NODE_173_length_23099_cov_37.564783_8_plen_72_part_00
MFGIMNQKLQLHRALKPCSLQTLDLQRLPVKANWRAQISAFYAICFAAAPRSSCPGRGGGDASLPCAAFKS